MKLDWESLLNDKGKFPRTFFFEDSAARYFRYGINEQLQFCLFFHLPFDEFNRPTDSLKLANISLEEQFLDGQNTIVLTLLNDSLKVLFNDLIISIVSQVKELDKKSIKSGFISLCKDWFELFDPIAAKLTRNEVQGIIAELHFLKFLLNNSNFTFNEVLKAWKGPFGKGHDFELGESHFEVKGIQENKLILSVSSEYQLDFLENQKLFLIVYSFLINSSEGETLGEVINETVLLLRSHTASKINIFWTALRKAGLNPQAPDEYNEYTFKLKDVSNYNCSIYNFPSIRRSLLPDSVRQVKYELATTLLNDFKVNDLTPFI
ncbi:PD-(D/E)XK motif protein [Pedobacter gandavensis]|uniref:PD-(D/E)XK motif protein n=1 Tax=Pedobacter gandavensis TaxID=2679963 RepID=UPI00292D87B2|nr:PD-(D/E)XK motif protein [Pedobacter gandavensis]